MSFFQIPSKISERSGLDLHARPSDSEVENLAAELTQGGKDVLAKTNDLRTRYIEYVKTSNNRSDLSKAFIQLAFAALDSQPKLGLTLIHDCLTWYPGQHWVMSRYISYLEKIGKSETALDNYWRLFRHFPDNPHAYTQLGNYLVRTGLFNLALIVVKSAVRNFPEDSIAQNCLADVYLKSGHFENAILCYKDSIVRFPGNPISLTGLADSYLKSGRVDEAISTYNEAALKYPNDKIIMSGMADAYLKNGDVEKSISTYQKVIEKYPRTVISLAGLADAYLKAGQHNEAMATFSRALRDFPTNHVCLNGLGNAYLKVKNYPKAIEIFTNAVEIYPNGQVGLNGLAAAYLRNGDLEEAIEIYKDAIDRGTDNHFFYEGAAEAYIVANKYDEAEEVIKDGLIKFSNNYKLLSFLIELDMLKHKFDDARSICEEAREHFPEKARFYFDYCLVLLFQEKIGDAFDWLEQGLAMFQGDAELSYLKQRLQSKQITRDHKIKITPEYFSFLEDLLAKEVPLIRDNISRNADASSQKVTRGRKYNYYYSKITDEITRLKNSNHQINHLLVMLLAAISDELEFSVTDAEIGEISQNLPADVNPYDKALLDIVLKIKPNKCLLSDQDAKIKDLIAKYGEKWELSLLKLLCEASKGMEIDELSWNKIFRSHSENSDFNYYLYAYAYLINGNNEKSAEVLDGIKKKITGSNSPRQKLLWLFDHSKTSIKFTHDWQSKKMQVDWFKIRMILLSEFSPLMRLDNDGDSSII